MPETLGQADFQPGFRYLSIHLKILTTPVVPDGPTQLWCSRRFLIVQQVSGGGPGWLYSDD